MAWTKKYDKEYNTKQKKLSRDIREIMSNLCVNALYVISKRGETPLNPRQIDEIIDLELSQILKNLQDPKVLEVIKMISKKKFENLKLF